MRAFLLAYVGCLLALLTHAQIVKRRVKTAPPRDVPSSDRSAAPKKHQQLITKIRTLRRIHDVPPTRVLLLAALDLRNEAVELGDPHDAQAQRAVVAAAYAWRSHIDDQEALAIRASMREHVP